MKVLMLIVAGLAAGPAIAQDGNWQLLKPAHSPGPSMGQAMVYDARNDRSILFNARFWFGDPETWAWDGADWHFLSFGGPASDFFHAAAFDTARGLTVVFGGASPLEDLGQTWEFDGGEWALRATNGPTPRSDHSMAYDAARGVTVLFGGHSGEEYFGDTWEWNGQTWTERQVQGPPPRSGATMAYDSSRGVTVLFGGQSPDQPYLGDTWEWDGQAWTDRGVQGPEPRTESDMTYDPDVHRCILFGGWTYNADWMDSEVMSDTWAWDGQAWSPIQTPASPSARSDVAIAYDALRHRVLLFGGLEWDIAVDDTWALAWQAPCPPDLDGSGALDLFDFLAFTNLFNAEDPAADWDHNGAFDLFDFLGYVNAFNAGC